MILNIETIFVIVKGTTWTQEMVWCIMNNQDYKTAKEISLETRVPFFEYVGISDSGEQSQLCKNEIRNKVISMRV